LNSLTLVTSFTLLIFAGSVPLLIQSSDADAFKVCKTPKGALFIPKDRECPKGSIESNGSTKYSGKLIIEFTEVSGNSRDETFHEVRAESAILGSLDQQGQFDLSSTSGTGACSIFHPSNAHQVFAGTPKFQLTGDTRSVSFTTDLSVSTNCSIPNPAGEGFPFHTFHEGYFESEGRAARQVFCEGLTCSREWYWALVLSPVNHG
jgi:hypothetical protein